MAEVVNPNKLDDDTVKIIEEYLAMDCSIEEVCLMANISKQTYYNWVNSFPELKERFDLLRATPFLKARKTIVDSLSNPQYAFEYMKRKRKSEFSERLENTGADGNDLIVRIENYGNNGNKNTAQIQSEGIPETNI